MVFSGIFPIDSADYENLRDALEKLQLNDSAFTYEPETSTRSASASAAATSACSTWRSSRSGWSASTSSSLITTAPSVVYKVYPTKGERAGRSTTRPSSRPSQHIEHMEEPILTCHIHVPDEYLGAILKLCQDRRGIQKDIKYLGSSASACRSPTRCRCPRWCSTSSTR